LIQDCLGQQQQQQLLSNVTALAEDCRQHPTLAGPAGSRAGYLGSDA
jgi:hypothetical protein